MTMPWAIATMAVFCLAIVAIFSPAEPDSCQTYLDMRQIYEDTNGNYGWPRGAIKECENVYDM